MATAGATSAQLSRILRPRSIALVGVSGRADSLNARPLRYLRDHGFAGEIYPVNPNHTDLQGLQCYPSLGELPGPVDLVLSMVPAAATAEIVRQAGTIDAAGVVVFASGFAESGPLGSALQNEIVRAAREAGLRLLGPNCQGLIHAPSGLFATFTAAADREIDGASGVAYVGQSGAVGGSVLDLASEMGIGLAAWVSTGNQADLDLVEIATAVLDDEAVRVVMLYAEVIPDGAGYEQLARRARETGKHVVVLLSGRSEAGRRAAASHTGSMLGDDTAFVLSSAEHGVTLVDDVDEMLAVAAMIDHVRRVAGRRVGVITTSGGAGSLAADQCARHNLSLPEITAAGQQELAALVPDFGAVANPVDVTAQLFNRENSARALGRICEIVAAQPDIDLVGVLLTMVTGELGAQLAEDLIDTAARLGKPMFVVWLAGRDQTVKGRAAFRKAGMPVFDSVGDFARTAGLLAAGMPTEVSDNRLAGTGHEDGDGAVAELEAFLAGTLGAEDLLRALGIASPASTLATSAEETVAATRARSGPVAVKLQAADVAHKSDLGGVRLGVTVEEAADVYDALMKIASDNGIDAEGVAVQDMIAPGTELILGVTSGTDGYPPVVTVGIGGVTTEVYRDIASALAPITPSRAVELMRTLHGWPLLAGFRGAPPADLSAAADAVAAVSRAAAGLAGRAFEFEINPLIVAADGDGACAVDLLGSAVHDVADHTPEHDRQES